MSFGARIAAVACLLVPACDEADSQPATPAASGKADDVQTTGEDAGSDGTTDGETQNGCPDAADVFPEAWPQGGPACPEEAVLTVHRYDRDTFILRQSLCTSFEAPFIYLLFGEDAVLVEDTGAGGIPIADAVEQVVSEWKEDTGKDPDDPFEIIVINSHAHGDHVAGNTQLEVRPGVEMVGFGVDAVSTFLDIDWPHEAGVVDLGGREIEVIPIPGHEDSHVALWDHGARLLLTGDTLYAGRIFVDDFETLRDSVGDLTAHVADDPPCFVLGTHIEMTNEPGVDFEFGLDHHPDEHPLQLTFATLQELDEALSNMGDEAQFERHDDFIVFPL